MYATPFLKSPVKSNESRLNVDTTVYIAMALVWICQSLQSPPDGSLAPVKTRRGPTDFGHLPPPPSRPMHNFPYFEPWPALQCAIGFLGALLTMKQEANPSPCLARQKVFWCFDKILVLEMPPPSRVVGNVRKNQWYNVVWGDCALPCWQCHGPKQARLEFEMENIRINNTFFAT